MCGTGHFMTSSSRSLPCRFAFAQRDRLGSVFFCLVPFINRANEATKLAFKTYETTNGGKIIALRVVGQKPQSAIKTKEKKVVLFYDRWEKTCCFGVFLYLIRRRELSSWRIVNVLQRPPAIASEARFYPSKHLSV